MADIIILKYLLDKLLNKSHALKLNISSLAHSWGLQNFVLPPILLLKVAVSMCP